MLIWVIEEWPWSLPLRAFNQLWLMDLTLGPHDLILSKGKHIKQHDDPNTLANLFGATNVSINIITSFTCMFVWLYIFGYNIV